MINSGIQSWAGKNRSLRDLTKSGEKKKDILEELNA